MLQWTDIVTSFHVIAEQICVSLVHLVMVAEDVGKSDGW